MIMEQKKKKEVGDEVKCFDMGGRSGTGLPPKPPHT